MTISLFNHHTSRQQRSFDATIVCNFNVFNESSTAKCFVDTYIVFTSYLGKGKQLAVTPCENLSIE